jgi:hypothetical protein
MTSPRKHEFSPMPSEVLRYFRAWLRGFHRDREKSKAADWAMVGLTALGLIAAGISAVFVYLQLRDAQDNFRVDERAWIELEPIKLTESNTPIPGFPKAPHTGLKFEIRPKNVGKTVAREIDLKAIAVDGPESLAHDARELAETQDQFFMGQIHSWPDNVALTPPKTPTLRVLAPGAVAPVPLEVLARPPREAKPDSENPQEQVRRVWYIIGRIDYLDEFSVNHAMKFCYFVTNDKGALDICEYGNEEDHNTKPLSHT